jgi:hypothetical protein
MKILILFFSTSLILISKPTKKASILPSVQLRLGTSNGTVYYPVLDPYYTGSIMLLQNQYNQQVLQTRIPKSETDLGIKYLNSKINSSIKDRANLLLQEDENDSIYKVYTINDHGKSKNELPKLEYLLWKYNDLESVYSIEIQDSRIKLLNKIEFTDKSKTLKELDFKNDLFFSYDNNKGLLYLSSPKKYYRINCVEKIENNVCKFFNKEEDSEFSEYIKILK